MKRSRLFSFILFAINLAGFSVSAYDGCTKESSLKSLRLRKKLLCDYDTQVRPSESGVTKVTIGMIPKFVEFDDASHTLTLHSWTQVSWQDPHLRWKTDVEFADIFSIHIQSDEIWKPDLSVYNSGEIGYEETQMPSTNCIVQKSGRVACLPPIKYVTRCSPNYQHWPFDIQNCTIRLGSWVYKTDEIDYQLAENGSTMIDFTENPEWKVLSLGVQRTMLMYYGWGELHPSLTVNVVIERHSTYTGATAIGPAILLILMTLTVLWLSPMTIERMILAGLNLICHLLCIMDLDWRVPFNGSTLPSILVFHQSSMAIACVAFFLTALLRQLKETSVIAPGWLMSTTSVILDSRAGQFVLLTTLDPKASATLENIEEDNSGLVQSNSINPKSNPGTSTWHHLATFIDRLSFFVILITYFIMVIVLVPKNDIKDSQT